MPIVALLLMVALQGWQTTFHVDPASFADHGESPYFQLTPRCQSTFGNAGGKLVILVLADTLDVGGVTTRVVEEREWKGEALVEVSRNYYAIDRQTGDVYYFGEDVDAYERGRIVNHEGSWRHGRGGARFGLMMPARPATGMKFYEEQAKGTAMDRAEIVSVAETVTTPGGRFGGVVKVRETTPLEPLSREYKLYAPGVGLVQDGDMKLVSHVCAK